MNNFRTLKELQIFGTMGFLLGLVLTIRISRKAVNTMVAVVLLHVYRFVMYTAFTAL